MRDRATTTLGRVGKRPHETRGVVLNSIIRISESCERGTRGQGRDARAATSCRWRARGRALVSRFDCGRGEQTQTRREPALFIHVVFGSLYFIERALAVQLSWSAAFRVRLCEHERICSERMSRAGRPTMENGRMHAYCAMANATNTPNFTRLRPPTLC